MLAGTGLRFPAPAGPGLELLCYMPVCRPAPEAVANAAVTDWVTLSDRWWIVSMGGFRIEQGPGEPSLGEDQGCTARDRRKGHRSGTVGDQPTVLITIQIHVDPQRVPCHARSPMDAIDIDNERFRASRTLYAICTNTRGAARP